MYIYSQTILIFLKRLKAYAKEIIVNEMRLPFYRERFEFQNYRYPLSLVVFERKNVLGFFEADTYQIGIHKSLMYTAKEVVIKNILRHELAHYLTYLTYKDCGLGHGKEFRQLCHQWGWGNDVTSAKSHIEKENLQLEGDLKSERIIEKIKKLLSLASSENVYEAELATIKANQLLIQHNLDCLSLSSSLSPSEGFSSEAEEDLVYMERVLIAKKNSAKMQTISGILKTFFVRPVYNYGKVFVYLEVTGNKTNVEIALFVATFLDRELDHLWEKTKRQHPELKGVIAKNSFMTGIMNGYVHKMQKSKKEYSSHDQKQMMVIENNLEEKLHFVYGKLSKTSGSARLWCEKSSQLGNKEGQNLSIRPAIKSEQNSIFLLD